MSDMTRQVVWSALALIMAAGCLVLIVQIGARASAMKTSPILIRDKIYPGVHHLTGSVSVPETCEELIVHTEQVAPNGYRIIFETWENPALTCYKAQVPREFTAIAFAPSIGTHFTATLDGDAIPIAVVQDISEN